MLYVVHVAMMGGGFRYTSSGSFFGGASFGTRAQDKSGFEVSSVKANRSTGRPTLIAPPIGNRFQAGNATLRTLIRLAFRYEEDSRILGGPAWMNSDRFDVEARAGSPMGPDQMMLMLRSLLEERFHLRVHREMRDMPVYFLVIGKDGHKMEQLKDKDGKPILVLTPDSGLPPPPPPPSAATQFAALRQMNSWGWSMGQVASMLTRDAGRPVIDKTGLIGLYVFKLQWSPDPLTSPDAPPAVSPGPSIFTAVQEQLGLRLEPRPREPIEFLVIDGVEKPSDN